VSKDVTVGIVVDSVQAQLAIKDIMEQAAAATKEWKTRRAEIISGIRQTMTMISSLMSSFRQAMSLIGEQIDPFFSALIGMVLSTVSMLLSVATGLAATGPIGSAAAAVVLGIAISLNILTTGKLIADHLDIKTDFTELRNAFKDFDQGVGSGTGGHQQQGFGF